VFLGIIEVVICVAIDGGDWRCGEGLRTDSRGFVKMAASLQG
jgi:hypothetical protein